MLEFLYILFIVALAASILAFWGSDGNLGVFFVAFIFCITLMASISVLSQEKGALDYANGLAVADTLANGEIVITRLKK
jgi:hypothetical protein